MKHRKLLTPAIMFIVLFGVVSMFSDMTHEGAASIRGAYLALLGASGSAIGFISGVGELVGYSLRYIFGRLADKTGKYWTITIIGYAVDVFAVPALALVSEDGWIWACALIIIERIGKAVKKPAKNTLVSFAASQGGVGKGFALQEMLDQFGAFLGPVLLYIVMLFKKGGSLYDRYSFCFAILLIPAVITIIMLFVTKAKFPNPEKFEPDPKISEPFKIKKSFGFYIAGISFFAFGFIDYSLIIMHVAREYGSISSNLSSTASLISSGTLPLLYAGAMLIDAISAYIFGILYDKKGFMALVISTAVSLPFAFFVFAFNSVPMLFIGIALWGVGMGAQESILKAAVSTIVPKSGRATGYGIFEMFFGVFWFLGSWLLGTLYDLSIPAMIAVSASCQLIAIPMYINATKNHKKLN